MNSSIKFNKKPKFKDAYLIAAWPGMGEVAFKAVNYLKEKLKCEEFAYLNTAEFFPAQGVEIHNQEIIIPVHFGGKYYFYKNRKTKENLIIFTNDRQPPQNLAYEYAEKVLEIANFVNIKRIFTFAAMPVPIEYMQNPRLLFAATKRAVVKEIKSYGLQAIPSGQISGLNGLLLGVAARKNLEGVCLLSEIPLYTIHIENPRASFAVLKIIAKILNIDIQLEDLLREAVSLESEIDKLVDYIKASSHNEPIGEDEIERIKKSLAAYTKLPDSAKKKIESLFRETERDISKANVLKKELDDWNVYKEYEDRFLDLFRKTKREDN